MTLPLDLTPKTLTILREGYGLAAFKADAIAGLTVAIVALPLSMALAIASGVAPEIGLVTAIIGGLVAALLGGTRVQVSGPAAAFIVMIAGIVHTHGAAHLVLATLLAGLILIVAGLLRLGSYVKYVPQPVVTGFTSGIAVTIAASQISDWLGLKPAAPLPAEFIGKIAGIVAALGTTSIPTLAVGALAVAVIIAVRRLKPGWPAFLIGLVIATLPVYLFGLEAGASGGPIATIGSKFGQLPRFLPAPHLPIWPDGDWKPLIQDALMIAFLAGVESLLSAVVADGMTGRRHRSNMELVALGAGNIASALFGGLPVTGVIARTATNIRAGARSPMAAILHCGLLLLFMMLLAPLMLHIPLTALAAILLVVAWYMSEFDRLRALWHAPRGDRLVLFLTFALTVLVDLNTAIIVGVVLSALIFMHHSAEAVKIGAGEDENGQENPWPVESMPQGVSVLAINGPLFFGAVARLSDLTLDASVPRFVILRFENMPMIDASGQHALSEFIARALQRGTDVILCGLRPGPAKIIDAMGLVHHSPGSKDRIQCAANFAEALAITQKG